MSTDQQPPATAEVDAMTLADDEQDERDRAFDLNPERCPYTWTPGADTPLGQLYHDVRCTREHHEDERHHWDSAEQRAWTAATLRVVSDAAEANPARLTPGTAYRVRVDGGEAMTLRTMDADA